MIFTLLIVLSAIFFLNGLQYLNKIRIEMNWTVNLFGGLLVVKYGFDLSRGLVDESFAMLPQDSFPVFGSLLIVLGSPFVFTGFPYLLRQFSKEADMPLKNAANPLFAALYGFAGVFSLISGYAVYHKIGSVTILSLIILMSLIFLLLALHNARLMFTKKFLGLVQITGACLLFSVGALVLIWDVQIP